MIRVLRLLVFSCVCAFAAHAQATFNATKVSTLSSSAEVVTIQQPASGSRVVRFDGVSVYCSAQCDFTIERDGAAATATAFTPAPANPNETAASKALAYYASDVGTGTVIGNYTVPSGGTLSIDLSKVALLRGGTSRNCTVRISAMTGNVKINFVFIENSY